MYFDHAKCPSCGAQFDPESIQVSEGAARCPGCKGQLNIKSLFGVAAHLADADAPEAAMDDLVAGFGSSSDEWRTTGGYDPLAGQGTSAPKASERRPAAARQAQPPQGGTGMVKRPDPGPDATGPSAVLQALRDIKKGR
ncbi:MAG: hypothetical protein AB8H79_07210 [Myxococcota bacterium]